MDQSVGGDGLITNRPGDMYPPATVEYSVETSTNPDVLSDDRAERQRNESEVWVVVSIDATRGYLNMEEIWFHSRLTTASRHYELSHTTQYSNRGVRSRGMIKPEQSANALYLINESDTIESWGYTDDARQDVTVNQV